MSEHLTYAEQVNYPFMDNLDIRSYVANNPTFGKLIGSLVDVALTVPTTLTEWPVIGGKVDSTRGSVFGLREVQYAVDTLRVGVGRVSATGLPAQVAVWFAVDIPAVTAHNDLYFKVAAEDNDLGITGVLVFNTAQLLEALNVITGALVPGQGALLGNHAFNPRVHTPEATKLTALVVMNDDFDWAKASGALTLKEGHNIALTQVGDDTIRIDAGPGAGLGQLPCIPVESQLSNETIIEGDDCYEIVANDNGVINIVNRCEPCCSCEDYLWVLERLQDMTGQLNALKQQFTDLSVTYNQSVEKYKDLREEYSCFTQVAAMRGPTYDNALPLGMRPAVDSDRLIKVVVVLTNVDRPTVRLKDLVVKAYDASGNAVRPYLVTPIARQVVATNLSEPVIVDGGVYGSIAGTATSHAVHSEKVEVRPVLQAEFDNAIENYAQRGHSLVLTFTVREGAAGAESVTRIKTIRAHAIVDDGEALRGATVDIKGVA